MSFLIFAEGLNKKYEPYCYEKRIFVDFEIGFFNIFDNLC